MELLLEIFTKSFSVLREKHVTTVTMLHYLDLWYVGIAKNYGIQELIIQSQRPFMLLLIRQDDVPNVTKANEAKLFVFNRSYTNRYKDLLDLTK